jgi:RNA polymerase sigma-70 factor (ECF subfamily)
VLPPPDDITTETQSKSTADAAADDGLVARIARGDAAAETQFVREYGPGVRALVRRKARAGDPNVDDYCQDVLHNVLLALRRGELRDPAALGGYVRNAVVFTVQAEYRKRARRGEDGPAIDVDQLASGDDPARATQRLQLAQAVDRLVAELPVERDRELLRRHYRDEQDVDEVCAALGIELSHFRRVAHRARERLRVLLDRAGIGDST